MIKQLLDYSSIFPFSSLHSAKLRTYEPWACHLCQSLAFWRLLGSVFVDITSFHALLSVLGDSSSNRLSYPHEWCSKAYELWCHGRSSSWKLTFSRHCKSPTYTWSRYCGSWPLESGLCLILALNASSCTPFLSSIRFDPRFNNNIYN